MEVATMLITRAMQIQLLFGVSMVMDRIHNEFVDEEGRLNNYEIYTSKKESFENLITELHEVALKGIEQGFMWQDIQRCITGQANDLHWTLRTCITVFKLAKRDWL